MIKIYIKFAILTILKCVIQWHLEHFHGSLAFATSLFQGLVSFLRPVWRLPKNLEFSLDSSAASTGCGVSADDY